MTDTSTKFSVIELYLDYVNNFLTIEKFAEHYNMDEKHAKRLIDLGKDIHEHHLKMMKGE